MAPPDPDQLVVLASKLAFDTKLLSVVLVSNTVSAAAFCTWNAVAEFVVVLCMVLPVLVTCVTIPLPLDISNMSPVLELARLNTVPVAFAYC